MPVEIRTGARQEPVASDELKGEEHLPLPPEPVGRTSGSKRLGCAIESGIILLAVILGLVVRWGAYDTAIVTSRSMEPTLHVGDRMLVDHRRSLRNRWARRDIVFFDAPESWGEEGERLVKRIIGLPGETVELNHGKVFINGAAIDEPYTRAGPDDSRPPIQLRPGEYFLLGDNRPNSDDSRNHGPVSDRSIYGRAVFRLGPLGRFGGL